MNRICVLIAIMALTSCHSKKTIEYHIDLNDLQDDRLTVEVDLPKVRRDTLVLNFAAMDPGHMANYTNFGIYCRNMTVLYEDGSTLEAERIGKNSFEITNAGSISKIFYTIDDTWDDTVHIDNQFASAVGTSFSSEHGFILNGGIYCFVEEMSHLPVRVSVSIPDMFIATGSNIEYIDEINIKISGGGFSDIYDNPILISKPDTARFSVAGSEFTVAVLNEEGTPLANHFASEIKLNMEAIATFLGGKLLTREYYFLFYIKDMTRLTEFLKSNVDFNNIETVDRAIDIFSSFNNFSQSALEHSSSSLFAMQANYKSQTSFPMISYVCHEYLHIITPKRISSEFIRNYNFSTPRLSQHRWLYEGVTEYHSGMARLAGGVFTVEEFLANYLRPKIIGSLSFPDTIAFTEFSRNANVSPYKDFYVQSYDRAALLSLCLDIEIIRLTDGQLNLKDVLLKILDNGNPDSITEENLVDLIVSNSHPGLSTFFDTYIFDSKPIPVKDFFDAIGIKYYPEISMMIPDFHLSAIPLFQFYQVTESGIPGVIAGDKIDISMLGNSLWSIFKNNDGSFVKGGDEVTINVFRNGDPVEIRFPALLKHGNQKHRLEVDSSASEQQIRYRRKWSEGIIGQ